MFEKVTMVKLKINTLLVGGLAGVVVAVAACSGGSSEEAVDPVGVDGLGEAQPIVTIPHSEITANHVNPPVSFSTSPSTGGDHFAFWHNCGFYTEELIEGAATHSLEQGAVWITYGSSLPGDEVSELEALAAGNPRLLISPYDHDDPIVLSAWGAQQRGVQSASDPAVAAFITEWVDNPILIEAGATCSGAVGIVPDRTDILIDGTPVPEEFLS